VIRLQFTFAILTGGCASTRQANGEDRLPRLFHAFPDGRTGLGLLLLRAAVGTVALIQGGMDLAGRHDPTVGTWVAGLLAVAAGIALLAGFLTPIAAALVGIGATGTLISIVPVPNPDLFTSKLSVTFLAAVAAAIVLLGPGAFSFDARLFGLREIIIPSRSPR
jgi:uncharacterized membrane protein YphA (DoxX/SURF4 family)